MIAVDQSDSPPASEVAEAFTGMCQDLKSAVARLSNILADELPQLNAMLAKQSLEPLSLPKQVLAEPACN